MLGDGKFYFFVVVGFLFWGDLIFVSSLYILGISPVWGVAGQMPFWASMVTSLLSVLQVFILLGISTELLHEHSHWGWFSHFQTVEKKVKRKSIISWHEHRKPKSHCQWDVTGTCLRSSMWLLTAELIWTAEPEVDSGLVHTARRPLGVAEACSICLVLGCTPLLESSLCLCGECVVSSAQREGHTCLSTLPSREGVEASWALSGRMPSSLGAWKELCKYWVYLWIWISQLGFL